MPLGGSGQAPAALSLSLSLFVSIERGLAERLGTTVEKTAFSVRQRGSWLGALRLQAGQRISSEHGQHWENSVWYLFQVSSHNKAPGEAT